MPKPLVLEAYLLVEGNDDRHVVWHLCKEHALPEKFTVEMAEGITELLDGLTIRIRAPGLRILGIMVDADENVTSRWQAIRDRLQDNGKLQGLTYTTVPAAPPSGGWISAEPDRPRIGVWIMPDNQQPGKLEDFAVGLIPGSDRLLTKAELVLQEIDTAGLRLYSATDQPKALIHTWLAWQQEPGQPLGTAITARSLRHNAPLALAFVDWLRRLFDL